jgi:hypothetical protein
MLRQATYKTTSDVQDDERRQCFDGDIGTTTTSDKDTDDATSDEEGDINEYNKRRRCQDNGDIMKKTTSVGYAAMN